MKKQLLLAIIVLGTLNNVSGMDVVASESPELWKQKRNIELQKLVQVKESLEYIRSKKEMYSNYSFYNLMSYCFRNKAHAQSISYWQTKENQLVDSMKNMLTSHTEEDLAHEGNLFKQHQAIVDAEITQLSCDINEAKQKDILKADELIVNNKNITEHANLVAQKKRLVTEQNLLSSSKVQHYKRFYRSHTQKSYRDLVAQE